MTYVHYNDVIMSTMALQFTILTIVYSTVYWCADQRKHHSSASLAVVRGIHRWPVNSPHNGPVTWKMFPFDDGIVSLPKSFLVNSFGYTLSHHRPRRWLLQSHINILGELCSTLCAKTPLYVRSGAYIKQMPLGHLSYIKQIPLGHLLYIKETS